MAHIDQLDLFQTQTPAEPLDDDSWRPPVYVGDPVKVRAMAHKVLSEARAAQTMPWSQEEVRFHCTVFPQMTNWLPPDEADELRAAFAAEIARLKSA